MKRLLIIACIAVALGWCLYAFAGVRIARVIAAKAGSAITRLGEGKVVSAANFVHRRMFEAAWLGTLLLAWAALHGALSRWQQRRCAPHRWAWLPQSTLAFACLNLWLWQAGKTALFWGLMWQGQETQNLTRFHLKLILAREDQASVRAVLVGSSQTRAQIDEVMLNAQLGASLRTTELHYPGSKAYDIFLLQPMVSQMRPDYVICYVTEAYFHSGSGSEAQPNFLRASDLPDLRRRGGLKFIPTDNIGTGLLGEALPLFRLRQVLSQRLFGAQTGQLKQHQYDAALETDLTARARRAAKDYHINDESRFQQRALEDLVIRCQRDGQQVILLAGQLNPLFGQAVDPAIREAMLTLLRRMAREYPNVTLVENLPEQTPADYLDVTHVNQTMQERFTQFLADWLRRRLVEQDHAPGMPDPNAAHRPAR